MSDNGTTTFGVDTASYQPLGTYDPRDFEIINIDDPGVVGKARMRNGLIPWGVYLWVYPGHNLYAGAMYMIDKVRSFGFGDAPLGYWFDYEDAGINEGQLHDGFRALDDRGVKGGYYSGPSAVNHSEFLDRNWWDAAYPTGAVEFPGYGSLWASSRPRHMNIWQYTSGGGLDRNVIVDDEWYAAFVGQAPAPTPAPEIQEDPKMFIVAVPQGTNVLEELWTETGIMLKSVKEAAGPFLIGTAGASMASNGKIPFVVLTEDEYLKSSFGVASLHDRLLAVGAGLGGLSKLEAGAGGGGDTTPPPVAVDPEVVAAQVASQVDAALQAARQPMIDAITAAVTAALTPKADKKK